MAKTKTAKRAAPKPDGAKVVQDVSKVEALLKKGCTVSEYAETLGISRQAASRRLHAAVESGVLVIDQEAPRETSLADLCRPHVPRGATRQIFRLSAKGR